MGGRSVLSFRQQPRTRFQPNLLDRPSYVSLLTYRPSSLLYYISFHDTSHDSSSMADPITIIGAVGAICNIVDAVTKTITTINLLRSRWKEAGLSLASLTAQLAALRAALSKIQEWIDLEVNETHHQLTMDLDISVSCCKILIDRMEAIFNEAARANNNPRDILGKLKLVYGIGALDELQKLVERQTGSLNLLLTACNWYVRNQPIRWIL